MMRWPDRAPFPVWIRLRKFARRYGPPCETWIVSWVAPATDVRRERGFATRADAEAWIARIYADPELATGGAAAAGDSRRPCARAADMVAARTLVVKTAPSGPRRFLRPPSP